MKIQGGHDPLTLAADAHAFKIVMIKLIFFFVWADCFIRCRVLLLEAVHSVIIESRRTKCPI